MKNRIVIRMNGGENSVTVDGRKFDRSKMGVKEKSVLKRLIVAAFFAGSN